MTPSVFILNITGKLRTHVVGEKLYQYSLLIRFHRPIGSLLLLWPTLTALWMASHGVPESHLIVIFCLGTFLMRSAGCAINDFADRHVDPHVSRTQGRPLATGVVQAREAVIVAVVLAFLAFLLVLFLNWQTTLLACAGVLIALIYPFMKRYTHLPQLFLGIAFAWGVPMVFTAVLGTTTKTTWLLFLAALVWPVAYDTMYAMVDREDDLKVGVKSTAILFGDADVFIVGCLQACVIVIYLLVGQQLELGAYYYFGVLVAACLAAYQIYVIRNREPEKCFAAFLQNNWLGLAVFLGVVAHYALGAESIA